MTDTTYFYKQLDRFTMPVGLIYYVAKHERKWNSLEECHAATLSHLHTINDYDPMQLHGCKTDEELLEMANKYSPGDFKRDQESDFNIKMVAIKRDTSEEGRCATEALPEFDHWLDHSKLSWSNKMLESAS
jgi:hypothetical protein